MKRVILIVRFCTDWVRRVTIVHNCQQFRASL